MQYIALDAHKHYTFASVERANGALLQETQLMHERGVIRDFLCQYEPGSPVAVEAVGNWYWLVNEIEEAGMVPHLVHPRKAKLMLGMINKTDKLDARGLNRLQRTGTLPTVWIPPATIRDQRDLPRTRMVLTRQSTRLKNRLHATFAKYAIRLPDVSDVFSQPTALATHLVTLPSHTRFAADRSMEQLEIVGEQIDEFESRMHEVFEESDELKLLMTLPGVGFILGTVILLELGDVSRFPDAVHLASYAGVTPRISSSGGKKHYGPMRPDVNHYLKWAYIEAANVVSRHQAHWPHRHVTKTYVRIRERKNHAKAVGAVARHLAEATFWMLTKKEAYREPALRTDRVHEGVSAAVS